MNISDCMKRNVISISEVATIREAAVVFAKKHISVLPVVNSEKKVVGVVSLRRLLDLELPDFVRFISDVDFVHDFGAVENIRPRASDLAKPITSLMRDVNTVEEDCGLLRAYALMLQHELHDMPVVSKKGKLIGIVSRVDIGSAILSSWSNEE